jgi:hypothetical protein
MSVAALRFVRYQGELLPRQYVASETMRSERLAVLAAMSDSSVESLQALIILAYTEVKQLSTNPPRIIPIASRHN